MRAPDLPSPAQEERTGNNGQWRPNQVLPSLARHLSWHFWEDFHFIDRALKYAGTLSPPQPPARDARCQVKFLPVWALPGAAPPGLLPALFIVGRQDPGTLSNPSTLKIPPQLL